MSSPASWCCASSRAAPSARRICARNIARLVPLLKTCHPRSAAACADRPTLFWVFHVIRDYVRAARCRSGATSTWPIGSSGSGAAADRVRPSRSAARQLHRRRQAAVADRLGVWRLRHGDVRSRQPVVQRRVRRAPRTRRCSLPISRARSADELRRAFAAMKAASALREALWAMVSDVHLGRPASTTRRMPGTISRGSTSSWPETRPAPCMASDRSEVHA